MLQSDETAISGYLQKKTRDGRWQKRWFETNGVYLTYYKSRKMEKLLAALSLPQVGEIKLVPADLDPEHLDGLFTIELNTRIYTLRAKSDEEAKEWVRILGKLRRDGIQNASKSPMTQPASSTFSEATLSTRKSDSTNNTEWIKSGKMWCGCC